MLFVQFEIGEDPYLLEAAQVAEVLPMPTLKALPGAPAGVAGVVNYHGQPVPVLDLVQLAAGRPAAERLSTRLLLVRYPAPGGERLLGLIAERATSVVRADEGAFANPGVAAVPWLGGVAPAGPVALAQRVKIAELLSPEIRSLLFQTVEKAGGG